MKPIFLIIFLLTFFSHSTLTFAKDEGEDKRIYTSMFKNKNLRNAKNEYIKELNKHEKKNRKG